MSLSEFFNDLRSGFLDEHVNKPLAEVDAEKRFSSTPLDVELGPGVIDLVNEGALRKQRAVQAQTDRAMNEEKQHE